MIRFIAELYRRSEYKPERAIAASVTTDQKGRIVSKIDCSEYPTTGYWIDWGGYYDNPTSNVIAVYFAWYLSLAASIVLLIFDGHSLYRSGSDTVYITTDLFPWQYQEYLTELSIVEAYSSAVSNPDNPSDDTYDGRRHPTYLKIPSVQIKLPDAISGSALQYATFSLDLQNEDGNFDLIDDNNFFNTPAYILKSVADNPAYSDFGVIRRGFSDNLKVSFAGYTVTAATVYRSLSDEVCNNSIDADTYPDAGDNIGNLLPVAWGSVTADAIKVADDDYIFIDPDYVVSIDTVYDSDGATIDSADYTVSGGVVTMLTSDVPNTADITARAANTIGSIITTEMQEKSRILYGTDLWDTTETDDYISDSPGVNFLWDGGAVRDLIADLLKSDNAFLIEKSNGKLSLRSWGGTYTTHNIPAWTITQQPTKEHINSKYYLSTARVKYDGGEVVNSDSEKELVETYRKSQTLEFETHIATGADAETLAESLVSRFGSRNEEFTVSFGIDTSGISLLDKIYLEMEINGRRMTNKNIFVVKSIDPAQDVIVMEAVGQIVDYSGLLATPAGPDYNGDMSGYAVNSGAKLAQPYYREDL